jgi:hypothetical protein
MQVKDIVKEEYGEAARRVTTAEQECCGASSALDSLVRAECRQAPNGPYS